MFHKSHQSRSAKGGASTSQTSLATPPDEDQRPDAYALYRQRTSGRILGSADLLVGIFANYQDAMDARDADIIVQLAAVGGFQSEVAHLITAHTGDQGSSYYPMIASVGGRRVLSGEELEASLRDTERWLQSQRQI